MGEGIGMAVTVVEEEEEDEAVVATEVGVDGVVGVVTFSSL